MSDGDGDGEGYNLTLGVHILVLGEQYKDIEGSLKVFAHWAGRAGMKHWPVSVWKFCRLRRREAEKRGREGAFRGRVGLMKGVIDRDRAEPSTHTKLWGSGMGLAVELIKRVEQQNQCPLRCVVRVGLPWTGSIDRPG